MKRTLIIIALVGVAGAVAAGFLVKGSGAAAESYRFVQVTRGDVQQTVSSTGTLGAVRTVQVGTQVSGQISELHADFNDHVRKGQVIARLDSTLLAQAVQQAQTDVDKARSSVEQTRFLADQAERLHAAESLTDTDYRTAIYNAAVAQTALASSQIALSRAQQNLEFATIRAPIDGIVIERDVDVGQTVAASLQAPQLFLIAEDLRRMQILASVDESDIGTIDDGQPVRFTVQAFPNRTFVGQVHQVRMQSKTDQNIVSYTVVVSVDNADGVLLPGMTATVTFEVAKAANVLRVPNAALRFRPSAALAAEVQAERAAAGDTGAAGLGADSAARAARRAGVAGAAGAAQGTAGTPTLGVGQGQASGTATGAARRANVVTLWYLDASGKPQSLRAHTGLTDGQFTEVTGPALREGMQVIAGLNTAGAAAAASSTATVNPFQSQQRQGPRPPGGM
ncbi:MAG: efflux RND transporter periplasmic adaptor subunit [Gemmatimonadales bacterium]|jgi:HlyD family secretion protein